MHSQKTVAIIGAGPSGLSTAKECLAFGLSPKIFEQASHIGGLWSPETGGMWSGMRTNLSKYTCTFSDFVWPENTSEFPCQREVYEYLSNYCDHFSVREHIYLNTPVIKAKQLENSEKWMVTFRKDNTEEKTEEFDFLVVASGVFSLEYYPNIPGKETFGGKIYHSLGYKGPESLQGDHVAVIGGSFSGAEIAADIGRGGKKVTNVVRNPLWILPRYIPDASLEKEAVPLDLVFYKRGRRLQTLSVPADVATQKKHEYFKGISEQNEVCADLEVKDFTKPTRIAITDDYLRLVKEGQITIKKGDIVNFDKTGINFADGSHQAVDSVVFCTGYLLKLPFFEQELLDKLCFDPVDQFVPLLLYKSTFHPDFKNLSFVGVYRGPYFGTLELQSRWTASVFGGKAALPDREAMLKGVEDEKNLKNLEARPQFPHGDYIGFADSLAEEFGAVPDFKRLEQEDPVLYEKLMKYSCIPAHYRLTGPGENKQLALKQIDKLVEFMK